MGMAYASCGLTSLYGALILGGAVYGKVRGFSTIRTNNGQLIGAFAISALLQALAVVQVKQFSKISKLMKTILSGLHKRVQGVREISKAIEKTYLIINKNRELKSNLALVDNIIDFSFAPEDLSKDLANVKDLLGTSVVKKDKFGFLSHAGNILAAHSYLSEVGHYFIAPLEALGEIDAYLSIVKLIKEHRGTNNSYCFVDFVDQKEPVIDLTEAWNPLINLDKVKAVSIKLGETEPNNLMLTGPHGGGKSTLEKTIAYCILGQTFGIAPAKKARMTIFDKILTSVNIKENMELGYSTFMAEKFRIEEIVKEVLNSEGKKIAVVVDEPFKGTMEDEGTLRAYKFGFEMAKHKNVVCMMATHFRKPADLDIDTNNFANYHFEIAQNSEDSFTRTFNLSRGKCDWWYDDPKKREQYIDFALRND